MTLNSNDKSLIQEDTSSNNLNNDKLNDFQSINEISSTDNLINSSTNNLNSNDNLNNNLNINSNDNLNINSNDNLNISSNDNLNDNSNDKSNDNNLNENDLICSTDNQILSKNDLIDDNKDELILNKDSMETNVLNEDIEMKIDEIEKSPIKKKDHPDKESPKKRIKSTPKKDKEISPLIRQPKLQINDKTMKKLKSDTDDLIFDTVTDQSNNNHTKYTTTDQKLKNNLLVPVVSNVLSRSIAAIFCNSPTINKNGEFNSYSALGFNNKGPRVKRVCRSFNDVYKGMPRAVFPINLNSSTTSTTTKSLSSSTNKSNKSTNSPNKRQNKKNLIKQSSASTSNSSFKIEDELETECSYDSDDLDISEYIARNLKKEMQSS